MKKRTIYLLLFLMALPFFSSRSIAQVDLVKVDKSARQMYLFQAGKLVKKYHIALGANPKGHKRQEGDKRTPEGHYTLDFINEESAFYRSIRIDYPNDTDKQTAKRLGLDPGGQIMIHGQRNGSSAPVSKSRRFNWTDGCIALSNEEMDEFLGLVDIGTPIQIEW